MHRSQLFLRLPFKRSRDDGLDSEINCGSGAYMHDDSYICMNAHRMILKFKHRCTRERLQALIDETERIGIANTFKQAGEANKSSIITASVDWIASRLKEILAKRNTSVCSIFPSLD